MPPFLRKCCQYYFLHIEWDTALSVFKLINVLIETVEGTVLMDFSIKRLTVCMPHDFLIRKLKAWWIEKQFFFYLCHIFDREKKSVKVKGFQCLIKFEVPQGFIPESMFCNIFINNIYYSFQAALQNFADDNMQFSIHYKLYKQKPVLSKWKKVAVGPSSLGATIGMKDPPSSNPDVKLLAIPTGQLSHPSPWGW